MYTDGVPTENLPATELGGWDQCDHCRSPLDLGQRYCVVCGARRPQSDDPAARWLADARRAQQQQAAAPPAASGGGSVRVSGIALAAAFALLPVAAGIGVFAGRGSGSDTELLVAALKAQRAPVVNVVGGGAGAGSGSATADAGADETASDEQAREETSAGTGEKTSDGNEVLSSSRYGDARRLTGARVTEKTREESRSALDKIVNSKGREYVDSQRGLPDQIVIP